MSVYNECSACSGFGYETCVACICSTCNELGKIACANSRCNQGREACSTCGATGNVKGKFLGLVTVNRTCGRCEGKRNVQCQACQGKGASVCSRCNGAGRHANCSKCAGSKRIRCLECEGNGKILSDWARSLSSLDRRGLEFEHQKRQSRLQQLEIKISRLSREQDEEERIRNELREQSGAYRHAWTEGLWSREISQLEAELRMLEEEIEAIDRVMSG